MSDNQPIDLDDLQRVAVLARERYGDNWVADMVELAGEEIARLREERRWIPVTEMLPVEGVEVFVGCFISQGVPLFHAVAKWRRTSSGSYVWEDDDCVIHHPTHWQPLPPPPGEGEVER